MKWIVKHDIVVISELKRSSLKHVPGYVPVVSTSLNPSRGGVAVLFKHNVYSKIEKIDRSIVDQVWFELKSLPNVKFGGVYIPPDSSPYFDSKNIAEIQGRTQNCRCVVIGDFNSRCGKKIYELEDEQIKYTQTDLITNDHGKSIVRLCKDNNLCIVNGASFNDLQFSNALTFP